MSEYDLSLGGLVLIGDHNYQSAGIWETLSVLLFGRRDTFVHLGKKCTISWWNDVPYLIHISEV